jgi:hypothetical protein
MNLTRANAKALGMGFADVFGSFSFGSTDFVGNFSDLDGYILFSDLSNAPVRWSYDYNRLLPAGNTLDFLTTAIHEIGHVLGYVSGIDNPGWISKIADNWDIDDWDIYDTDSISDFYSFGVSELVSYTTPLDLFRYSATSTAAGLRDMTYGSLAGNKYFSTNQGKTAIAQFSTGANIDIGGDGQQASHWKPNLAMMSPTLALGQRNSISTIDRRAFDTMGWDLSSGGINTSSASLALSALSVQATQSLANQAGQSLGWVLQNLSASPTQLVQNRDAEIMEMIQNSQIYHLGDEEGDGFWQTIQNLFHEQGLFATLDELEISADQFSISQINISQINISTIGVLEGQITLNSISETARTFEPFTPTEFGDFVFSYRYPPAMASNPLEQGSSSNSNQQISFSLEIHYGMKQIGEQVLGQDSQPQKAIAHTQEHRSLWESEQTIQSKVIQSKTVIDLDGELELDTPIAAA